LWLEKTHAFFEETGDLTAGGTLLLQ